jgi:hypothetical protein
MKLNEKFLVVCAYLMACMGPMTIAYLANKIGGGQMIPEWISSLSSKLAILGVLLPVIFGVICLILRWLLVYRTPPKKLN